MVDTRVVMRLRSQLGSLLMSTGRVIMSGLLFAILKILSAACSPAKYVPACERIVKLHNGDLHDIERLHL